MDHHDIRHISRQRKPRAQKPAAGFVLHSLLEKLHAAVLTADDSAGFTMIKPCGQPWRECAAIPRSQWEAVRQLLIAIDPSRA